jgi:hypothetical protein
MLNIIQNTIGAIRRVGESVVRAGLKMWLPFTKAEPLGENLVVNGDFATDSNWLNVGTSNTSISNGKLIFNNSPQYASIVQLNVTEVGKFYQLTLNISDYLSGSVRVCLGGNCKVFDTAEIHIETYEATINTAISIDSLSVGNNTFSIDNISIKEATQISTDISGNDNNAILKTGKALVFDGNDSVETSFPSSKTIKTIAFWIYPTHSAQFETLFNLGITNIPVSPLGDRVIQLNHLTISNKSNYPLNFDVYIDGVYRGETNYNGDNPTLSLNQWQRVVFVNSNGTSTVNDTFDIAYTGSGSHGRFKMSDLQIYGAEFTTDDIAYDYANPQSLVTDNASSSVTLNDLHAWWHMSEGDGTIAFDSAPLIGKELVVNGDFATDSDWTYGNGWDIDVVNNKASYNGTGSQYGKIYQVLDTIVGKTYKMTFTLSGLSSSGVNFGFGSSGGSFVNPQVTYNANGTYTRYMVADRTDNSIIIQNNSATQTLSLDNISVKEVFNIDGETYDGSALGATYDDAQERIPQLGMMNWSKGSNLIEYSEDLTEWSELASAVVSFDSSIVNPDNTVGCYKVTYDGTFRGRIEYNVPLDGTVTQSVYLKVDTGTETVKIGGGSGDLADVTVTDEWQRFSHTATYTGTSTNPRVRCDNSATIYVWGVQYEASTTASAYRRTDGTAVTDATLISSATDSQKDILGNAVRVKGSGFNLDGTGYAEVLDDNDFDIPACNNVDEGGFTLAAWVKAKYINKTSSINVASTLGGDVTQPATGGIVSFNTNKLGAYINAAQLQADSTFIEGNWYYVVLTRADNGICKLYIDTNAQSDTDYTLSSITNTSNKMVGRDSLAYQRFYEERIDDVKFYDRELSSDEIDQNYNATKSGHNN